MRQDKRGGHWGWWLLTATLAAIYALGWRMRAPMRQASVEAIDAPEVTEAWDRITRLPQFYLLWRWTMRVALDHAPPAARVLDVGCGAGQLVHLLAAQPPVVRAVGIDLSDALLHRARQRAEDSGLTRAEFFQVDGAEMPFPNASFDIVVSTLSLHHWDDPVAVLGEIRRVLVPGGRAIIIDLRRNASPFCWGLATLAARYLAPRDMRAYQEPVASLQAAYTPCELLLLAVKAGWRNPSVTTGPCGQRLDLVAPDEAAGE
ncbi:MAG TPA: class I SAM-dependent methyltransferase [Armatimonadota bacterium]|jgi:ubiquinone/menaquinone biosynthesis C-methylase UbiE